jgi:virulence-associated protein VagC
MAKPKKKSSDASRPRVLRETTVFEHDTDTSLSDVLGDSEEVERLLARLRNEPGLDESEPVETKVFRSGNSDAVRLPKAFGLTGKTVLLSKLPNGRIVIEPKFRRRWPAGYFESLGRISADFTVGPRERFSRAEDARVTKLFESDE